jgi:predicted PolB exonuclease-like 3'-5' exonuclease
VTLVGHNAIGFDIPFLWKRAMILGVKPPREFPRSPKPWGESVIDTMLLWDSQQRAGGSMDRICRLLGIPGKGDMDGSMVWPMYQAGRLTEIAHYCKGDVERTRSMHRRMTFA